MARWGSTRSAGSTSPGSRGPTWSTRTPGPSTTPRSAGPATIRSNWLFRDYATNPSLYPAVHEYFRATQVPLLAIWGAGDEIFAPAGATAFARDLPDAEIHLIDGGHFLLESALDTAVGHIRGFLGRTAVAATA